MSGTTLDDYTDRYARRVRGMTASEIRALFAVANRPEVVSLAGGAPYIAALPLDAVGEMLGRLASEQGAVTLQYGIGQGTLDLRERICEVMSLSGIDSACGASPEDVVVTVGGQQALDLVARLFLDPGDVVLAEGPTYVGALGVFQAAQAQVVHVPMDDDGLIPAALSAAIADVAQSGRRAKFLYTIPTYQNPGGVTLSEERREQVLDICERAGLLVIEDDPYGQLSFEQEAPLPLRARRREGVFYLSTFSKTFAPGMRVGWILAPHAVRDKLVIASEAQILCPSAFAQAAVTQYLTTMPWREQLKTYREIYRERRDALLVGPDRHDARRHHLDPAGRWAVRVGDAARGPRLEGDDAAGDRRPGGIRAGHRLLRRRHRHGQHAAQLLVLRTRPAARRRAPARRGDGAGSRDAAGVRRRQRTRRAPSRAGRGRRPRP